MVRKDKGRGGGRKVEKFGKKERERRERMERRNNVVVNRFKQEGGTQGRAGGGI